MKQYKDNDYLIRRVVINGVSIFDIENEHIDYATFGELHHGLQTTNFMSDSSEYEKILIHCAEIIKNIKEIDKILYNK